MKRFPEIFSVGVTRLVVALANLIPPQPSKQEWKITRGWRDESFEWGVPPSMSQDSWKTSRVMHRFWGSL